MREARAAWFRDPWIDALSAVGVLDEFAPRSSLLGNVPVLGDPLELDAIIERTRATAVIVVANAISWEANEYVMQVAADRRELRVFMVAGVSDLLSSEVLAARGVKGPLIGELTRRGQVEVDGQVVHLEEVSEVKHGQSMAFVMDTRPCDGALALARGADLLVCESTYLEEHAREAHDHFHMTARQAAELAREAGVHQLVLTHFSQRYPRVEPFVEQASAVFPNVVAAKDGMHVPLPKREKPGRADAS